MSLESHNGGALQVQGMCARQSGPSQGQGKMVQRPAGYMGTWAEVTMQCPLPPRVAHALKGGCGWGVPPTQASRAGACKPKTPRSHSRPLSLQLGPLPHVSMLSQ